jgi:nicotinamidase-related amidase
MNLQLPVRYWPQCPPSDVPLGEYDEKALLYGETTLEMAVEQTAFMLVDCWNITREGPPAVPDLAKYWDYNFIAGGISWLARAEEIVETKIQPCLTRAREIGMAVIHAPSSYIAEHYPQCRTLAQEVEEPPAGPPRRWPPAEFVAERWQQFMALRYGEECETYWNRLRPALDIADALRPLDHEVVFSTLAQLEHVFAERRILHVILAGFAANACLLQKPGAVADLAALGYQVVVLRDCTTAIEAPWSVDDLAATRATMDYVEMAFGYTATSEDFLEATIR